MTKEEREKESLRIAQKYVDSCGKTEHECAREFWKALGYLKAHLNVKEGRLQPFHYLQFGSDCSLLVGPPGLIDDVLDIYVKVKALEEAHEGELSTH
jgi:hypothetical protein